MSKKGKSGIILDNTDLKILEFLSEAKSKNKLVTTTELSEQVNLTYPGFLMHLKRLESFIERKRDKQTIYINIRTVGNEIYKSIKLINELKQKKK